MTDTAAGRRRLGRGLEALLGPTREEAEREGSLVELPVSEIHPNPYQPRRDVDPVALQELKSSIQQAGLLQPVVVRPLPNGGGFELIAGERRLRACQALGWERIPAVKREVDDRTVLTLALIENLQRDDLSPVDEARGYERLIQEFNLTQQDVAAAVGRDRSTVANALRLLRLPDAVLTMIRQGHRLLDQQDGGDDRERSRPQRLVGRRRRRRRNLGQHRRADGLSPYRARAATAPQARVGAGARGAACGRRIASPPGNRCAGLTAGEGEGSAPHLFLFQR